MRRIVSVFFLGLLSAGLLGAPVSLVAGTLAQFRTVIGDIEVELFDDDKPVTVQNFLRYVRSGAYNTNQFVHRWYIVGDGQRFVGSVLQGGGYEVRERGTTNAVVVTIPTFGAITNEFSVGRSNSNAYGTIAMARSGAQTNSASSQWFINLRNNEEFDTFAGGYTVFGRVVRGTNVLERFTRYPSEGLSVWNAGGALASVPAVGDEFSLDRLLYVDITLLQVRVTQNPDGSRTISWDSVSNQVNRVEHTAQFPPDWQSLVTTNGNGSRFSVTDTNTADPRFYRIRVDFDE